MIDGVLYFTVPDHVWALDARTGRELWHYAWQSKGGIHIGNRGVAVARRLAVLRDARLPSGVARHQGRQGALAQDRSAISISSTTARSRRSIVKNHVIAGVSGDDLDIPGYLQSHDPETGELQWRWYVVPQKKGDPGSETWPNEEAMKHGGGMTWQPVTYDPDLNLIYVTTGNPQPVIAHKNRAGDNLFTGSIVALNPDTGKMVVVLPVVAARHARLGLDADAGAVRRRDQRPAAQAARAGGAQRPLLRARSRHRQGARLVGVRQDQLVEGLRREGPADSQSGEGSADRRRAGVAQPGRRDQLAAAELQPADRTVLRQRRRAPSASTTSTTRATTRRAGAAPIAAASRSRCCRRSTTRPARSSGATSGKANVRAGLLSTAGNLVFTGGTVERSRGAERDDRRCAVARAAEQPGQQRPDHLRARRHCSTWWSAPATRCGRS